MRSASPVLVYPVQLTAVFFTSLFLGYIIVALTGMSVTWMGLFFVGIIVGTLALLSKDLKRATLYAFAFAAPVDIQKAFLVPEAKVSPGFAIYAPDVFLFPLVIFWLWDKWVIRKEKIYVPTGITIASLFLAWTWWTGLMSLHYRDGILASLTFTKFYLVYVLLADIIRDGKTFRGVLNAFGLGLVANIVYAGAQFVTKSQLALQGSKPTSLGVNLTFAETGATAFRPGGFLHHPNALAAYLTLVLPVLLAMLFLTPRRIGPKAWWAALSLFFGGGCAMLVTLSRGGWISAALGCLFVIVIGLYRGLVKPGQVVAMVVAAVMAVTGVTLLYPNIYLRIAGGDHRSTESRIAMIQQATLIWSRNPIDGVGLGSYNEAAQTNVPHSFARLNPGYQEKLLKGVVHNKYMLVAAEQGTVGVLLLAALMAQFVWAFFTVKRWQDPVYCALTLGLCSGVLGQAVFYVFDHFYADVRIFLCWVAFGLIAALIKINKKVVTNGSGISSARIC